jgi:hypothetical protein
MINRIWPSLVGPAFLLVLISCEVAAQDWQCSQHYPLRAPWFGDLHVHTSLSLDASMQGVRVAPLDAYRFARGEAIALPPYRDNGQARRYKTLARPLDFAAVTDHAEMLGESRICSSPGMAGYQSPYCMGLRWSPRWFGLLFSHTAARARRLSLCGDEGQRCLQASHRPWDQIRAAAELAYDRSRDCRFTSFIGYEWTGAAFPERGRLANLHRNVIFKNAAVPALPISFVDAPLPERLYAALEAQCDTAVSGCDAVVIPHNSNLSLGMMFRDSPSWGEEGGQRALQRRMRYEKLVEIIQHKGASECFYEPGNVLANDELCGFEQLPWDSFSGNIFPPLARPLVPGSGFVREALKRGLSWQEAHGVNPYKLGFVGGTDSHLGLAGAVEEADFQGHGGAGNAAVQMDATSLPDQPEFNPGGLTVLYAQQNNRDSLFAAMVRRESYATSGPRITVRFFGGARLPLDYCERRDAVDQAYRRAVPMGGDLPVSSKTPRFVVSALKDPGTAESPGVDLQRVQIIKAWIDSDGVSQERVFDIAGDVGTSKPLNLDSCMPVSGYKSLCQVWQDPQFDPQAAAFYYARVLQQPTCRWSTLACNKLSEGACSSAQTLSGDVARCCPSTLPKAIQERAWTSPIWYTPPNLKSQ